MLFLLMIQICYPLQYSKQENKIMPVRKVKGGYKWGNQGKTYKSKKGALQQAKAAYASGYKKKKKK